MKALAFLIMLALVGSLRATLLDLSITRSEIHIEGAAGPNAYNLTQPSGELEYYTTYDNPVPNEFGGIGQHVSYAAADQGFAAGDDTLGVGAGVSVFGGMSDGPSSAYAWATTAFEATFRIAEPTAFSIYYVAYMHDVGGVEFWEFPPILTRKDGLWSLSPGEILYNEDENYGFYGILQPGDYQLRLYSEAADSYWQPSSEWYSFGLFTRAVADRGQTGLLLALGLAGVMAFAAGTPKRSPFRPVRHKS